jgi:hypothetical protein
MRYQRGTSVVDYNAKRNAVNITTVRGNFKAAGVWLSRGLSKVLGVRCPSEKYCAEQRKKSVYYIRISETETPPPQKFGPKKGAHDGTRTHVRD